MTSLNPVLSIERQLTEVLETHRKLKRKRATGRALELLEIVGIPAAKQRLNDYPHQFSGGMRQRVMIAMALACDPRLLIADEPTTALDVTIQAQILDLMRSAVRETGTALILITHDLGVVAGMARRINVMYAGHIVERAETSELFGRPRHPYTVGLLQSIPRLDEQGRGELVPIQGQPPDLSRDIPGCPFAPRCMNVIDRCRVEMPPLEQAPDAADGHEIACWNPAEGERLVPSGFAAGAAAS
jgi:oligopeptide transport system ATP-binding protein